MKPSRNRLGWGSFCSSVLLTFLYLFTAFGVWNKENPVIFPTKGHFMDCAKDISIIEPTKTSIFSRYANVNFVVGRNITFSNMTPFFLLSYNNYFGWKYRGISFHFRKFVVNFFISKYTQYMIKFYNNSRRFAEIHCSNLGYIIPFLNICNRSAWFNIRIAPYKYIKMRSFSILKGIRTFFGSIGSFFSGTKSSSQ